jgi:conjugal transfer pilus assembly protein TraU
MKRIKFIINVFLFVSLISRAPQAKCAGKFLNPITDICWSCIFPITLGGMKIVGGRADTPNPKKVMCTCPKPPIIQVGVPVSFWEAVRVIEVTRTPWCMITLGGMQIMKLGTQLHGTVKHNKGHRMRSSSYNVHYITYPVLNIMGVLMDWLCLEKSGADDVNFWFSELEASWMDTETQMLMHPEALVFANPIAQAACAADCVASSAGFPIDALFWCGGCQGSLYPFSGNVGSHVGGIQASLLTSQRILAKMHRVFRENITSGEAALCQPKISPVIKKSQYKTQMLFPKPQTSGDHACSPLGRSSALWGAGHAYPTDGEDFAYLLWRKRNCCFL